MPGDNLLITGGTFIQHYESHFTESGIWPSGLRRLHESVSPTAFHNSAARFDAPKCHPNTRVAILRKIIDWVLGKTDQDSFVLWLYGPAGAGKTAIAQTLAECCEELQVLLATFFFSRTDSTRNHSKTLIATLGYQIALVVPPFRGALEQVIDFDPCIFERSLETQLMKTIICPLESLSKGALPQIPNLIIIDGIDECRDQSTQRQILQAISGVQRRSHLRLKFLVTSRAESQIMAAFNFISLQTALNHLVLDDSYAPDQDIGLFLQDRFRDIRRTHRFRSLIPDGWPGKTIIAYLVRKSSGQFIHASIVVRFIDSPRHHPVERLEIVRGLRPPSHDLPFAELDELYRHILSSVADICQVLRALGILFILPKTSYYSNINARIVERVLSLEEGNIDVLFADLLPTLRVDNSGNIRFFHASLPDFLCDATPSQCYFVDLAVAYADMAAWIARTPDRRMRLILGHASDLIICCRDAVLTSDLKTSLLKMKFWKDDEQWLREIKVYEGHWHPAPYAFIRTLADKRSVDPGWDEIYKYTLATLDRWLVYKLDEIDHPLLPCLYTLKRRNPKFPAHSIMTRLLMSESDARNGIIKRNWNLFHPSPQFMFDFLAKFFMDPSRSRHYSSTSKTFAEGARYLLRYVHIIQKGFSRRLSRGIHSWAARSKGLPWVSRRLRRRRSLRVVLLSSFSEGSTVNGRTALLSYRFALSLLPKAVMQVSDPQEFASTHPFWTGLNHHAILCARRLVRVRRAIDAFPTCSKGEGREVEMLTGTISEISIHANPRSETERFSTEFGTHGLQIPSLLRKWMWGAF